MFDAILLFLQKIPSFGDLHLYPPHCLDALSSKKIGFNFHHSPPKRPLQSNTTLFATDLIGRKETMIDHLERKLLVMCCRPV